MADRFSQKATCSGCQLFVDDPRQLERVFRGILVLSSCYGSSRGNSGICTLTDRFQYPEAGCRFFQARSSCFEPVPENVTER